VIANTPASIPLGQFIPQKAGLPDIRFHDLCHRTTTTILISKGVHPKVVQEILGHSEISMTMDIYPHVLPTMQKDAMARLNQAFDERDHTLDVKKAEDDLP
jgi:site-specific recombinase XerD